MDPWRALVAFGSALVAGAINSVAGGGSLLTFPTLIWLGLPSINANATSTVVIWPGTVGTIWGYRQELRTCSPRMLALALPSVVGGILGALLLNRTPPGVFDALVPFLILFATLAAPEFGRVIADAVAQRHQQAVAAFDEDRDLVVVVPEL